jgi:centrosomal protein CEP41
LFKNKPDKLLVIYHEDERHGMLLARIIFEKGFDNLYLLSGGLHIFAKENPDLIEGYLT